jgi:hypothetical protein
MQQTVEVIAEPPRAEDQPVSERSTPLPPESSGPSDSVVTFS